MIKADTAAMTPWLDSVVVTVSDVPVEEELDDTCSDTVSATDEEEVLSIIPSPPSEVGAAIAAE